MKLEHLLSDPVSACVHAERYINFKEATRPYTLGVLSPEHSAYKGPEKIVLERFKIPRSKAIIHHNPEEESPLEKAFQDEEHVYFIPHPGVRGQGFAEEYERLEKMSVEKSTLCADPTASNRTFKVSEPLTSYVKTSFPARISGCKRTLHKEDIEESLWLTQELDFQCGKDNLPKTFSYNREPLGIEIPLVRRLGGMILREYDSFPHHKPLKIPLASVCSPDLKKPEDPLLIEQLAELEGTSVRDYFLERIVVPLIDIWNWFNFQLGVIPNLHGQNLLYQLDQDFADPLFSFRDFNGNLINPCKRVLPSHEDESSKQDILWDQRQLKEYMTLSYDFIIGELFLDRAIDSLSERGIETKGIEEEIAGHFKESYLGEEKDLCPQFVKLGYSKEREMQRVEFKRERPKYRR
ncbi:hypothetical protein HN604_03470 [archaeon]|jgi:hypothetical protein|nr:hypothetical protein [archaeon]MBT6182669.1 hypothetical protein [archaeon]MBT6606600.1 hypothetical protein [archaeon]MBT7251843.1 hypothetical protein [archaeon]MBT7661113.1 hypothetical protein [archaeon]